MTAVSAASTPIPINVIKTQDALIVRSLHVSLIPATCTPSFLIPSKHIPDAHAHVRVLSTYTPSTPLTAYNSATFPPRARFQVHAPARIDVRDSRYAYTLRSGTRECTESKHARPRTYVQLYRRNARIAQEENVSLRLNLELGLFCEVFDACRAREYQGEGSGEMRVRGH
jgi:hypothetical protein